MKGERKLGERCQCKASYYTCKSISDSDRQKIFSDVWKMTWGEKQVFVKLSVEAKDVKERRGHGGTRRCTLLCEGQRDHTECVNRCF